MSTAMTKFEGFRLALGDKTARNRLTALVGEKNMAKFATDLLVAVERSEQADKIAQCSPESFVTAALTSAATGLNVLAGEAALIPYGNRLTFQAMYKGVRKLALEADDTLTNISTLVVYDGDDFDFGFDGKWYCRYKPSMARPANAGISAFVAIAHFKDGSILPEVMTKDQVDAVRKAYSKGSPAWDKSYSEMGRKTVIKRLVKSLPSTPQIAALLSEDDGGPVDMGDAEIVTPTAPKTESTVEKARKRVQKAAKADDAQIVESNVESPAEANSDPPSDDLEVMAKADQVLEMIKSWPGSKQTNFWSSVDGAYERDEYPSKNAAIVAVFKAMQA